MPLPDILVPPFPNVPLVPGVPALLRSLLFPPTPVPAFMQRDSALVVQPSDAPKWGIFDKSGARVLVPDSVVGFSFMNEFRISDYPLEAGAFESYNKAAMPFDARMVMTKGGKTSDRQIFLDTLDILISSLDLVDVVTPDKIYYNANIIHYDYERGSKNGMQLLTVSVFLREIRLASSADTSTTAAPLANTQDPSGADPIAVGSVQPQPLTPSQHGASGSWASGASGYWAAKISGATGSFASGASGRW